MTIRSSSMPGRRRSSTACKRFRTGEQKHAVVVIFTSHSIPVRYISAGDPYQKQIEETVELVAAQAGISGSGALPGRARARARPSPGSNPRWSRRWTGSRRKATRQCSKCPIGFTCDHMETLYDIDIVHRTHAHKLGLNFERAESLNTSPLLSKRWRTS